MQESIYGMGERLGIPRQDMDELWWAGGPVEVLTSMVEAIVNKFGVGDLSVQLYPILKFFSWDHLPPNLATISRPFGELAAMMANDLPYRAETAAGLRKLLEAKDCAVRAAACRIGAP